MPLFPAKFKTFDEAQYSLLAAIMLHGEDVDDAGVKFKTSPANFTVLDIDVDPSECDSAYAKAFAEWNVFSKLKGHDAEKLTANLLSANRAAASWLEPYEGRNALYPDIISSQIEDIVEELKQNKSSRRATMLFLSANHEYIRKGKRRKETTIEYPCTIAYHFSIDDRGRLCATMFMRSSNIVSVLPYDFAVCALAVKTIAELIGVKPGSITYFAASAHIFESKYDHVLSNILGA